MASKYLNKAIFPFMTLTISTLFLIVFVYGISYTFDSFKQDIKKGVTVSGISISELPKSIAMEKLETEVTKWKDTTIVSFYYKDREVNVSSAELFFFDIEETLNNKSNSTSWPLRVYVNDDYVSNVIHELTREKELVNLDWASLHEDLRTYGQTLQIGRLIINVHDYLEEEEKIISTVELANVFKTNRLIKAVLFFDDFQLKPKQQFSFAEVLRVNRNDSINDQVYSVIATAIYQLMLETNIEIKERHISSTLPPYSELGLEARVDREKDLKIYNPNATSYVLSFEIEEHALKATLTGIPFEDTYSIELSNRETIDYEKIVESDDKVVGTTIKQQGQYGQEITVHRVRQKASGHSEKEWISYDVYLPVASIEVHGRQSAEHDSGGKGY
ncbi:hypothetical protein BKP35_14405 [Anaerobacillus arseniciselenatis]|uniref:G5 domain-containing protein n=1 Tax=Anaerobacillus arseniciselenatis TaxID=85682 RepID=A0A1S2LD46_9BACI|nr:VanW family protein [Anaerobacillus arseniciselenatis]OIJ10286.1 hypothetical protein BKP35_14405 [Anaerobacillus arseniciselenatis]